MGEICLLPLLFLFCFLQRGVPGIFALFVFLLYFENGVLDQPASLGVLLWTEVGRHKSLEWGNTNRLDMMI